MNDTYMYTVWSWQAMFREVSWSVSCGQGKSVESAQPVATPTRDHWPRLLHMHGNVQCISGLLLYNVVWIIEVSDKRGLNNWGCTVLAQVNPGSIEAGHLLVVHITYKCTCITRLFSHLRALHHCCANVYHVTWEKPMYMWWLLHVHVHSMYMCSGSFMHPSCSNVHVWCIWWKVQVHVHVYLCNHVWYTQHSTCAASLCLQCVYMYASYSFLSLGVDCWEWWTSSPYSGAMCMLHVCVHACGMHAVYTCTINMIICAVLLCFYVIDEICFFCFLSVFDSSEWSATKHTTSTATVERSLDTATWWNFAPCYV